MKRRSNHRLPGRFNRIPIRNRLPRVICGILLAITCGCSSGGVQEDRSINYDPGGETVGFQHGEEGVFVADGDGEKVEKIFDSEGSIAVSSPLFSPVDQRLIFAVAHPADPTGPRLAVAREAWDASPEGRRFQAEDIVYTCMLRSASSDDDTAPEPVPLFQAACSHPGYVAANLAVRWHPDGQRILFIDRLEQGGHSLFEFDLATKRQQRILEASGEALIFDWSPQHKYLAVLASDPSSAHLGGISICAGDADPSDAAAWWHVPGSDQLVALDDSRDALERLRAMQPAWTRNAERFACVVQVADDNDEIQHAILTVQAATREVSTVYQSEQRLSGFHWHPDGHHLGFVEGGSPASLRMLGDDGVVSAPVSDDTIRRFVGWNHDGTRLAYIVPESVADSGDRWALLFPRVPDARDRVLMIDDQNTESRHVVHEGVRITFPQWSPTENALSLWGTYTPTHRSWLSRFLPWTLRPGDPAAILNCDTGEIQWMAVNPHEQAQVGHYYLLKRDYAEAWKWYEQAAEQREPAQPLKLSEFDQFLRRLRIHQDPTFFEYYCLTKLNRQTEATARLQQFRNSMRFDLEDVGEFLTADDADANDDADPDAEQDEAALEALRVQLKELSDFAIPLIQSAFATEVFLSLDAPADGVAFFQAELGNATTDSEQLAALLCLSQLLLATDSPQDYATLVTEQLAPLLMKLHNADALAFGASLSGADLRVPEFRHWIQQLATLGSGGLALLPMLSGDFLDAFSQPELEMHLQRVTALHAQADDEQQRLALDVFQLGLLAKLGRQEAWMEVRQRVEGNPWFQRNAEIELSTPEAFLTEVERMIEEFRSSNW